MDTYIPAPGELQMALEVDPLQVYCHLHNLTDVVKMSNAAAANTVNNWTGLTYIMPLLVAPLAESIWSRFSTVLTSSFFYVLIGSTLRSTLKEKKSQTQSGYSLERSNSDMLTENNTV